MTKLKLFALFLSSQLFAAQEMQCTLAVNTFENGQWKLIHVDTLPVYHSKLLEQKIYVPVDGKIEQVLRVTGRFGFEKDEFTVAGLMYLGKFSSLKITNNKDGYVAELAEEDETSKAELILRNATKEARLRCAVKKISE